MIDDQRFRKDTQPTTKQAINLSTLQNKQEHQELLFQQTPPHGFTYKIVYSIMIFMYLI